MISILADEHIPRSLIRAVENRVAGADVVRLKDVGLLSAGDPMILEWAADHDCVVLTEDKSTLVPDAHRRVAAGLPMPGVPVIRPGAETSRVIDDIVLILICAESDDLNNQVLYLPV